MLLTTSSIVLIVALSTVNAQKFSSGSCDPNIEIVQNFDLNKYQGQWYVIKRGGHAINEHHKCFRFSCSLVTDVGYEATGSMVHKTNGNKHTFLWTAKPKDINRAANFTLKPGFISDSQDLLVLGTDYENFAVTYSCLNAYNGKLEFAWIIARTPSLDDANLQKAEKLLKDRNVLVELFDEQQDCK